MVLNDGASLIDFVDFALLIDLDVLCVGQCALWILFASGCRTHFDLCFSSVFRIPGQSFARDRKQAPDVLVDRSRELGRKSNSVLAHDRDQQTRTLCMQSQSTQITRFAAKNDKSAMNHQLNRVIEFTISPFMSFSVSIKPRKLRFCSSLTPMRCHMSRSLMSRVLRYRE